MNLSQKAIGYRQERARGEEVAMASKRRQHNLEKKKGVEETEQFKRRQRLEWACRSHAVSSLLTEKYQVESLLSKGSSAIILVGQRRHDNLPVAVKVIKTNNLSVGDREHLETEISIYQHLTKLKQGKEAPLGIGIHHVLNPIEVIRDPVNHNVYLVSEYLQGGDLFSRLESMKGYLMKEVEVLWILRQILSSLCFLHCLGVSHRDVKLENFVFVNPPGENCFHSILKIIDFGLCHWNRSREDRLKMDKEDIMRCAEAVGTLHYVPPEIIKEMHYIPEKVDSWEVGVVAYALITQKLPFDDWDDHNVFAKIVSLPPNMRTPCWDHISLGTKQLIAQLLEKDESKRITCEDAFHKVEALLDSMGAPHGVEADELIRNLSSKDQEKHETYLNRLSENTYLEKHEEISDTKKIKPKSTDDLETRVACQPVMNWQSIFSFFRRSRRSTEAKPNSVSGSFDIFAWKSHIRDKLKNTSPFKPRQAATADCQEECQRVAKPSSHRYSVSNDSQQWKPRKDQSKQSTSWEPTDTTKKEDQAGKPLVITDVYHCNVANSPKPLYSSVVSVL